MASLLDLAQARLGGLLAPRPSMAGLLGGQRTQANLASALQGYTPPQMTAMTNPQVMDYARNVAQTAQQNLQTQMSDLDKALVMDQGGINVGDRQALARLMEQVPGLMGATAYHGTPHNIRGQFDISKVGTGEGAQAYGHGMYFAENPAVAGEYKRKLSGGLGSPSNELMLNGQPLTDLTDSQRRAYEIVARDGRKNALGTAKDLESQGFDASHIRDALKATKGQEISLTKNEGNLYKVDIPDADIPNMLNWDEPLSKQPKSVQDALAKFDPDLYSKKGSDYSPEERGESIYMRIANSPQAKNFPEASAVLESLGIKGIRYLDAGSRPTNVIDKRLEDLYQKHSGDIEKAADDFMRTIHDSPKKKAEIRAGIVQDLQNRPTSNFVVFDPTDVKILEKNSQKVEGLLD
jgi:hypothetical protein